ncbi:hypothetical protein [Methylobacterium sp. 22177]|uniref:hypothetical protein n=1 Tax=Methylobacterium sp. 22177 TaxID=3453885 RepID=UPI003F86C6D6
MPGASELEDRITGLLFFARVKNGKKDAIELWSQSVLKDAKLSRSAVIVAWGLTYRLDDKARTFERRELLAKRIGLKGNTVDKALKQLRERGHILTRLERVEFEGGNSRVLTVTRPCFSWLTGGGYCPHPVSRSGGDSAHPTGGDTPHPGGGHSPHPCNLNLKPRLKPLRVEDVRTGLEDDWIYDPEIDELP